MSTAEASPQFKARLAGVFYLLTFVTGIYALVFVNGRLVANLIATACYVAVTLLFYDLFKPVNRSLSLLAAFFSLAGCVVGALSLFQLASFPINNLVFFGFYCLLIGYLIFRSTFLPRALGALMAFGGLGWLTFLSPELAKSLSPYNLAPGHPRRRSADRVAPRVRRARSTMERAGPRSKTSSGLKEKKMQFTVNVTPLKRTLLRALLICLLAPAAAAVAEERPLNAFNVKAYGYLKDILLRSAEKMPEENYNFKPTEVVRSFGQVLGHVADSQYFFCSMALGEKNPSLKIEKTKTTKAELVASLKEAFTYCDKAYNGMTDASGSETVKLFGDDTRKRDVLTVNNMHTVEHYGNLVTYLRLKNIVPPTSDQDPTAPPKK